MNIMNEYQKGELLTEGKTKQIYETEGNDWFIIAKSGKAITKNDDPSQTRQMDSKAELSTTTTSFVFELLKEAGIPVAFEHQISETEFLALKCKMISLEIVIRRYAVGSYLKRFPNLQKTNGEPPYRFHRLVFELFLKTTKGKIINLEGDSCGTTSVEDPFISNPESHIWRLTHPKHPDWDEKSELHCPVFRENILPKSVTIEQIEKIARETFLVLEGAWAQLGFRLVDFKLEMGIDNKGNLLVADVIDNDSWRLRTNDWEELSKQLFRDNADMQKIADSYALVANLVKNFSIPKQAVVFWRGSEKDQLPTFLNLPGIEKVYIIESGHRFTIVCLLKLKEILATYPEGGVIITIVGMSNGLGPMLASHTSWPIIAVPSTIKDKPHDVWSSLEMPSNVPLLTILSPNNAALAALNILAQKNPVAYMHRQYAIEELDIDKF